MPTMTRDVAARRATCYYVTRDPATWGEFVPDTPDRDRIIEEAMARVAKTLNTLSARFPMIRWQWTDRKPCTLFASRFVWYGDWDTAARLKRANQIERIISLAIHDSKQPALF